MTKEEKKQQLYEADLKKRFKILVNRAFMSQTDGCGYGNVSYYNIMTKDAPSLMGDKLWDLAVKEGLIEV